MAIQLSFPHTASSLEPYDVDVRFVRTTVMIGLVPTARFCDLANAPEVGHVGVKTGPIHP